MKQRILDSIAGFKILLSKSFWADVKKYYSGKEIAKRIDKLKINK